MAKLVINFRDIKPFALQFCFSAPIKDSGRCVPSSGIVKPNQTIEMIANADESDDPQTRDSTITLPLTYRKIRSHSILTH